jgi:hypothetical protein
MKTLATQFQLLKENKGNKDVFLKTAKTKYPSYVPQSATFNEAVNILKQKGIINENIIDLVPINTNVTKKESFELAFNSFLKEAKKKDTVENTIDKTDKKNPDNLIFDQIMAGCYVEAKNVKNKDKSIDEIKDIVVKNLSKDPIYYTKNAAFKVDGLGYKDDAPGLGTPKEAKGKYKSSGYGDIDKKSLNEGIHDRDILSRPLSNPDVKPLNRSSEELAKESDIRSENILRMRYHQQISDPTLSDDELRFILGGKGIKGFGGTPNAIEKIIKDRNIKNSSVEEIKNIVNKNLTKDKLYYVKDGQFGVKGIGYTTEHPGLGTPKEAKGKYKSSGYGDIDKKFLNEGKINSKKSVKENESEDDETYEFNVGEDSHYGKVKSRKMVGDKLHVTFDSNKTYEFEKFMDKWVENKQINESYGSNGDFDGTGLIVVGRTQIDNNEIGDVIEDLGYYGVWNSIERYWFIQEDESTLSYLEADLDKEFAKRDINARFEAQFDEDGIDYDDENFSDPLIDGEEDLFENYKNMNKNILTAKNYKDFYLFESEDEKPTESQLSKMKDKLELYTDKAGNATEAVSMYLKRFPQDKKYKNVLMTLAEPLF